MSIGCGLMEVSVQMTSAETVSLLGAYAFRPRASAIGSFDHLVGDGEQRWRDSEARCFGSLEIDHQIELGRLGNWQIRGLGTLENPPGIDADQTLRIGEAGAVTHQATGSSIFTL